MLVGEMPGNDEDLQGHPFVGPAGRVLDRVLEGAGIARADTYVTNVVKHFKWEARRKRRLHKSPSRREQKACLPWLDAEIDAIRPRVVVALGATAARALIGPNFRVSQQHGEFVPWDRARFLTATIHPSAVLRRQTPEERAQDMEMMIEDLRRVQRVLAS
jgi:DNA polymerase